MSILIAVFGNFGLPGLLLTQLGRRFFLKSDPQVKIVGWELTERNEPGSSGET